MIIICVSSGTMNNSILKKIIGDVEKENKGFAKKSNLDNLAFPKNIIGRETKAKELVRFLLGYKQGLVVPYISVYGRSGSGKSTLVRFVCQNLDGIVLCMINARKTKTVFGCANLILAELGRTSLKSAQGMNVAIEQIEEVITSTPLQNKLFVLVIDELDSIFYDKRSKPSDFIYRLVVMQERLREKNIQMCIIGISNNVLSELELDDRVRSRIGSSEVFFDSYSERDILKILEDRAKSAFSNKVNPNVLSYCAKLSSEGHGDARRAIDLLRVAAELANQKSEKLALSHIDLADSTLQKDRLQNIVGQASFHFKLVCFALAKLVHINSNNAQSTSTIYDQYRTLISKDKPLSYRRISEILVEIQNTGIATSETGSKGRHGFGTVYKLSVPPKTLGQICFFDAWQKTDMSKNMFEYSKRQNKSLRRTRENFAHTKLMDTMHNNLKILGF